QESTASSTEYGLLPSLNILTQFKSSVLLELDYAMKKQYTDVNKLVSSYMLSSYNSLYAGNRKLEAETYHRLRLTYRNFNLFYMSSFFARFSYTRKLDALKGSSEIEGVSQLRSTVNASLPDETIAGHMDYSKNIGKLKLSGKANVSYASYYGLVNGGWEQSEAVTQSYQASAGTFFTDLPNLTLGFRYGVNRYLRKETTTYRTQRPFARLELPVGKSLTLKADYSYYDYRNAKGTVKNTYQLLNGQLVFEKSESPWEFMLELNNLLNTRSISQDSINEYYTVSNQYFIQPAFALLSVKYKL
ncbi:MAG: putative porin, partial [Cytophagales bacterium]|nr:putative porin [Cytophagales bacterium]